MNKKLISHAIQATLVSSTWRYRSSRWPRRRSWRKWWSRGGAEDLGCPDRGHAFTSSDIQSAGINWPQDFHIADTEYVDSGYSQRRRHQVTIRGQYSTRDAESTFAYVVDGVLITNPNGFNGELYDVEQIEVLKGPPGCPGTDATRSPARLSSTPSAPPRNLRPAPRHPGVTTT